MILLVSSRSNSKITSERFFIRTDMELRSTFVGHEKKFRWLQAAGSLETARMPTIKNGISFS